MKSVLTVIIGIVIGALMMFCYFFFKKVEQKVLTAEMPKTPELHLEIYNQASKPLKRLSIQSVKGKSLSEFTNLRLGDKIYKNYPMAGQGTSTLFIEFENGKKMYSSESYVEGGYTLVQTIYDDSVHTDFK